MAFAIAANEAGGHKYIGLFPQGVCYEFIGLGYIVLDNELTGIKPSDLVAFSLKLQGKDGGGKDFAKGHLFLLRGGVKVCKNSV